VDSTILACLGTTIIPIFFIMSITATQIFLAITISFFFLSVMDILTVQSFFFVTALSSINFPLVSSPLIFILLIFYGGICNIYIYQEADKYLKNNPKAIIGNFTFLNSTGK
jgi:hypothetical protein